MRVLELQNVTKSFGTTQALKGISLGVRKGQIVSLLGPSGCGKTTTLRLIAGFEVPDGGVISISGRPVDGLRPYERNVGLVFQDYALFPHMTVAENLAYGMRHRGVPRSEISKRTQRYIELVQLTGLAGRYPRQLSGGQQQRVALARALSTEPEVMLLDEPLSALDAKLRLELRIELKGILNLAGCTAIIVTHDQEEAMSIAEEVIVMNRGEIVQRGDPSEIYDSPQSRFVAEFVGRSNWFLGELGMSCGPDMRTFRTDDGLEFRVAAADKSPGRYEVCVRPERFRVITDGESAGASDCQNVLRGIVRDVVHLGSDINVYIELANGRRVAAAGKNLGQKVVSGQHLILQFAGSDCVLLPCGS